MAKRVGVFIETIEEYSSGLKHYELTQLLEYTSPQLAKFPLSKIMASFKKNFKTKEQYMADYRKAEYTEDDTKFNMFNVYLVKYDVIKTNNAEYEAHEYSDGEGNNVYTAGRGIMRILPFGKYTRELYVKDTNKYKVWGGDGADYGQDKRRSTSHPLADDGIYYNKTKKLMTANDAFGRWDNGSGDRGYALWPNTTKITVEYNPEKFIKIA